MPLYWLVYRHNNSIFVVIEPAHSLIYARLRASLDGLDQGEFTGGHELPPHCNEPTVRQSPPFGTLWASSQFQKTPTIDVSSGFIWGNPG